MALWTDAISPLELTILARKTIHDRENGQNTLANYLPNRTVNDLYARFVAGDNGLVQAAEFRAFDAETPIGGSRGGKEVIVPLPAVGKKVRVSEWDRLKLRNTLSDEATRNSLAAVAVDVARAVADRMELMRGQVLATGKAVLAENQLIVDTDFGRTDELNITPSVKWNEHSTATPLADLEAAVEKYVEINGQRPAKLLLSSKALSALKLNAQVRSTATSTTTPMVSSAYVRELFASHDLPEVEVYDRQVNVAGQRRRVIDDKVALLLPESDGELGHTYWGTTLESTDPRYAISEQDRPGIVVGAYAEDDPMAMWVRANAIGLPVLGDANLVAALNVL